jgi:glycosyltransferase involved in cell wall biosynthesis
MTADAVGGVWRYCVDLITELAHCGTEIMLATMGPRPTPVQREEVLAIPRVSLVKSNYALEWMPDPWKDVDDASKWLLDLQFSFDADVIHLNGYAHASLPWKKPVAVVAHSCVYSWWRAVHGSMPGIEWAEYKRRVVNGLSAADVIVSPSAYMAAELRNEYGVSADKIRVIHNFTRAQVSQDAKKQPFVLGAGRIWDPAKNLELLDRIAPKLDWEVRIAGSTRGPEDSVSHSESARLLGNLKHPELLDQMDAASIFVHPALYEPFGLSVLEAARARCCLVLSDIPSLRELWQDTAIFIDPRQPDAWVRELNRLGRSPEQRETLGLLAYSQSMKYKASSSLKQYWELYASLIRSKTGVAA